METSPQLRLRWAWRRIPGKEFWLIHAIAIAGVIWTGWSWSGLELALALYAGRMLFVCLGYHRYFSHRTFKTSRVSQFVLAFLAQTSAQKGVLWWAAHHRRHHRYSDTAPDVHSAKQHGLWTSHVGWVLVRANDTTLFDEVPDLARYRELRWLDRWKLMPAVVLAVVLLAIGGAHALVWGFFVSTVLLWHGTFTINSLSHLIGRRRYATGDDSRNNWLLAIVTLGEGWHNNHHHYQSSARQGFFWWEYDLAYYVLRVFAAVGLAWDVRPVPSRLRSPAAPLGPRATSASGSR
jgi:stearoyl-CoA desaturase (delta-9 desaturase)